MGKKTYYVYAPFTGANWGQANYCTYNNRGVHVSTYPNPIDIGRSDGASATVWFHGSSGILSVNVRSVDNVCQSGKKPATMGIAVDMYCQRDCKGFIGTVRYGHIKSPRSPLPACINLNGALRLGTILSAKDWQNCPTCKCGAGAHTHMDTADGSPNSFACGAAITEGSTWIYKWKVDCGWQGNGSEDDPCEASEEV